MKHVVVAAALVSMGIGCGARSELVGPDASRGDGAARDGGGRDGALVCGDVFEPPQPTCDFLAPSCRDACERWAQGLTRVGVAHAWRGSQSGETCVRGTACTTGGPHACFCGRGRSCERGQVCVALPGEDMPSCRCNDPP